MERLGGVIVADTCSVVTPILPAGSGVVMTNSGKFAQYTPPKTGSEVIFATADECVETVVAGQLSVGEGLGLVR